MRCKVVIRGKLDNSFEVNDPPTVGGLRASVLNLVRTTRIKVDATTGSGESEQLLQGQQVLIYEKGSEEAILLTNDEAQLVKQKSILPSRNSWRCRWTFLPSCEIESNPSSGPQ